MNMLKLTTTALLVIAFMATTAFAGNTKTPLIRKRQVHQQQRIIQGLKSGQLTPREFMKLERQQKRIERERRRFASDGIITPKERLKLHRDLNRTSRHIFREKHDRQRRW